MDIRRGLAAHNPAAYRPGLADTLSNLGVVYGRTQRFGEAESAYMEALDIQRGLAAQNPAAHRPDLANTLTNLAKLYRETHRSAEAKAAEDEILKNTSK